MTKTLSESCELMLMTQHDEANLVVMDIVSDERQAQAMALLQLLAHGRRDIEEGCVLPSADVFAQIDAMDKDNAQ